MYDYDCMRRRPDIGRGMRIPIAKQKKEIHMDAMVGFVMLVAVLWGIEAIVTMFIRDHKKAKRKQAREKRRLEYQDRRMANDAEHAKVTRAMRYDVLRRDDFHCVRCGRGREDGVKLHVDHIVPRIARRQDGDVQPPDPMRGLQLRQGKPLPGITG